MEFYAFSSVKNLLIFSHYHLRPYVNFFNYSEFLVNRMHAWLFPDTKPLNSYLNTCFNQQVTIYGRIPLEHTYVKFKFTSNGIKMKFQIRISSQLTIFCTIKFNSADLKIFTKDMNTWHVSLYCACNETTVRRKISFILNIKWKSLKVLGLIWWCKMDLLQVETEPTNGLKILWIFRFLFRLSSTVTNFIS